MIISLACLELTLLSIGQMGVESARTYDEPYCGLYSMYAALNAVGLKPDFDTMNDSKYLSGSVGSTAMDLVNLARAHGSTGTFRENLTLADLRESRYPIVLHTKSLVSQTGFHHWIVFLGWNENKTTVYDPPRGRYSLSQAELLSHWDGIGVIIGKPEKKTEIPTINLEIILAFLLIAVFSVFLLRFTLLVQHPVFGIILISTISALTWHFIIDYGFFRNRFSLNTIATLYQSHHISGINDIELTQLVGHKGVTIIDARTPEDYIKSHIPGAINIPITITYGSFRDVLATIPVDNQIIVYCRSEECTWAESVANLFPARGYHRVATFPGGMEAWKKLNSSHIVPGKATN